MGALPTGTVTFLFTDIEGSTKVWEQQPDAMRLALARHDALLRVAIETHGGHVFKSMGDQFCAAFATAPDALAAALTAQRALGSEPWGEVGPVRVRMALHTGSAEQRDDDYFGPPLNRVSRLLESAHGGQVLVSLATDELVREALPEGASLRDLGLVRLQDLAHPEHVFQFAHPDLPGEFPPLRSLDTFLNNLPRQLTSFVGREKEMDQVKGLLSDTSLLTLTGSGGCGKTRLALQVAAEVLEQYPDGVWLVELAPLADPALVPQTVASALGVREEPGRPLTETLVGHLKPKVLLLILDNCEHLLTACAQLADALLRACPSLRMLASSREGLGIAGERTYSVPSLSLPTGPDARRQAPGASKDSQDSPSRVPSGWRLAPDVWRLMEYEAVRLFVERAVFTQPRFALTEQNAPAVVQVCERLDGIPLAIELAAARVKALAVEKLNERLDDMFRLLTGGSRTALPRQQTLRALIDWSYDLLSPSEKALLRRLAVFAGGWTLEAAEAVCSDFGFRISDFGFGGNEEKAPDDGPGPQIRNPKSEIRNEEVLDLLTSLVEKSLVLYEERVGEGRYWLLETVRQYARDRLLEAGEAEAVRGRHRDWFVALAEEAEPELEGADQGEWLKRLEIEHDNLRAALEWCVSEGNGEGAQCAEVGLRLGGALWRFWMVRSHWTEGRERLARLVALPGAEGRTAARAKALNSAGLLAWCQYDYGAARPLHEESLAIFRELGDRRGIAVSLLRLSSVTRVQGDSGAGRALLEESLAIFRELGDKRGIAGSLNNLGNLASYQGDYGAARTLCEESLAIFRELGDKRSITAPLHNLGTLARDQGEYGAARALLEESLAIRRELGNKSGIANSLNSLASVARNQDEYRAARALLEESLAITREVGGKQDVVESLEGLAAVAVAQTQSERAARLFGAADGLRESMGAVLPPADRAEHDRSVAAVRASLGEEAFGVVWAEGRAMGLEDAVSFALESVPDE